MTPVSRVVAYIALSCVALAAPAHSQKLSKQQQRFLALTPADFQRLMTVQDDSLDTIARFSTEQGFQEKHGLLGIVWNDNFLRAFIDKKTGETTFQLYQVISYGGDWRFYQTVNYETPNGPESKNVTVIDRSVDSCSTYGCSFTEHLAVEIPESLLRQIAAGYSPGAPRAWRFKFGSKAGVEFQDGLNAAEAVAILATVDQYRASHQFVKPAENHPSADIAAAPTAAPSHPVTAPAPPAKKSPTKKPATKRPAVSCVTCQ